MPSFREDASFLNDDKGSGTAWWVLWMLGFMVFGGVAADSANAWRMRAQLQSTADAAAHAGVIDLPNSSAAVAAANAMAESNMEISVHGDVLLESEIEVGLWDDATKTFYSGGGVDAIRVTTRRDDTAGNTLRTSFLRLIGMDNWNVNAQAIAQRYFPKCMNSDGLIARNIVDMQSNNVLRDGICIHGNDHVEVNNGNVWHAGVSVTMPSLEDLEIPSNDMNTHNPGLPAALGEEWFDPKIVDQTDYILNQLLDPTSPFKPSYIGTDENGNAIPANQIVITKASNQFSVASAKVGHIYKITCPGNSLLNLGNYVVLKKVVIIADCRIYTGNGSIYEDVVLGTFSGDKPNESIYAKSINLGQGNRMGANDNCDPAGNVLMVGNGSIDSAAGQQFYGVQAIAVWDITLAAQAQGLHGILLQAGNDISITSNNSFGSTCANIGAIQLPYFRLVL